MRTRVGKDKRGEKWDIHVRTRMHVIRLVTSNE